MTRRDIVVMGSSAGGIEALRIIMGHLPSSLDASIFIVQHLGPGSQGGLGKILQRSLRPGSQLTVQEAIHDQPIVPGVITVAPFDFHLLLSLGRVSVLHGPQENLARPAINPLFRSAASVYGPRVLGIVLSGLLDDGSSGLAAIKRHGGMTAVQDPSEAMFPSMPANAARYVGVHYQLDLEQISQLIVHLSTEGSADPSEPGRDPALENEIEMARGSRDFLEELDREGSRSALICPACQGPLWEIIDGKQMRYRCHVGHAFTEDGLMAGQSQAQEHALGTALRIIEERIRLFRRCAVRLQQSKSSRTPSYYDELVRALEHDASQLRSMMYGSGAGRVPRSADADDGEPPN